MKCKQYAFITYKRVGLYLRGAWNPEWRCEQQGLPLRFYFTSEPTKAGPVDNFFTLGVSVKTEAYQNAKSGIFGGMLLPTIWLELKLELEFSSAS